MPPSLRGMISDAVRRWWPGLTVTAETDDRDSPLIITWKGTEYRLYCTQVRIGEK